MAINTQKFLPSKKYELGNYLGKRSSTNLNIKSKRLNLIPEKETDNNSQILEVRSKLIQIKDLISSTTLIKTYEANQKRKKVEVKERKKREDELEKSNDLGKEKIKVPSTPGLGFLGRIKKFLFSILFGFIAYRLIDHLPKLIKFFNAAKPAFKFLETFSGSLFNSLVNLIDTSYKFVDKIKAVAKDFGGEEAAKNFDKFEERLKGFINSALLFKMLLNRGGSGSALDALISNLTGRRAAAAARKSLAERITKTALGEAPKKVIAKKILAQTTEKLVGAGVGAGVSRVGAELSGVREIVGVGGKAKISDPAIAKFAQKLEQRATKGELTLGKTIGKKIIGKDPIEKMVGKTAQKAAAKGGSKILGKAVPFIGPLVDFIISTVVFKEKPTRAAAGSVGSLLGSLIVGGLAGAGTLGIGAGVGAFVGGFAGDLLGRALYDAIESFSVKEYAGGGSVKRGKNPKPRRTIRPTKRSLKVQSTLVKPGVDIGGEKKITKVFPKSEKNTQVSPYDFMKKSSKIMSSTDAFGPLFDLQAKALLGQKPSVTDYRNAAQGLNAWMTNTFSEGVTHGGMAFANGGSVDASMTITNDMTSWIEASLRRFVSPKVDSVIKELMKSLMLEEIKPGEKETPQPTTDGEITGLQGSAKEFYDYLISKGLSPNNAMGLALNAARETGFNYADYHIDTNGLPVGGVFQWNGPRFTNLQKEVPDWKTNWKAQLDYALRENNLSKQYLTMKFNSPLDAANWWMREWERPLNPALDEAKHKKIYDQWVAQGMKQGQGPPATLGNMPGNLSAAQQIASQFGLTMTSFNTGTHAKGSLHYQNRAMDFSNGVDTPQQKAFAQEIIKKYGTSIKQLIYTPLGFGIADGKQVGLDYWGNETNKAHYDHVHVAFAKGGRVSKPTRAIIGERGPEFVFDADTTKGLDQMMPNLLENLNAAKNKSQLMNVLMSYTDYEDIGEQTITVQLPPPQIIVKEVPVPIGGSVSFGGGGSDPFANLTSLQ